MGDTSMKDCLAYYLDFVHRHLASADTTAEDWYDGGCDFEAIDDLSADDRESFANAWGYLSGAADMADVTVMELLDNFGLSLRAPVQRRPRCPKCGSGLTHRCKTGDCRHCNRCDHAWREP